MNTATLTRKLLVLPLAAIPLSLAFLSAHEPTPTPTTSVVRATAENHYIGADKCKNCHGSTASGDQHAAWSAALHSHAFETLSSDAAKALGAEVGIANPAESDACVSCHVTGFGEPEDAFKRGFKKELGVQCETCHGPGEEHMKVRFKAAMGKKAEGYQAVPEGEIVVSPGVETCVKCHNPASPSYKPFCYYEMRAKITHFDPRKPRTDEEKKAFGTCPSGDPCQHADGCPTKTCNLTAEELAAAKQ